MYPLLISAASSLASNLIDGLTQSGQRKAAAPENFAALLAKSAKAPSPQSVRETQFTALRKQLFDAPEMQSLLGAADPSKPPTLTLSADGGITAQEANGRTRSILLSPATADIARQLGNFLPAAAPAGFPLTQGTARPWQQDARQVLPGSKPPFAA